METKNINKLYKNKYYVYRHLIDGKIFYIGKGSGTRAVDLKNRSKKWNDFAGEDLDLVEVEIIKTFDCEKEAYSYERKLIKSLRSEGVELTNVIGNNDNKYSNKKKENKYSNKEKENKPTQEKLDKKNIEQFKDLTQKEFDLFFKIILALLEQDSKEITIKNYDIEKLIDHIPKNKSDFLKTVEKSILNVMNIRYYFEGGWENLFSSFSGKYSKDYSSTTITAEVFDSFNNILNIFYNYFETNSDHSA